MVFIAHYSYWSVLPSIVGLAFQLVVWGTQDNSRYIHGGALLILICAHVCLCQLVLCSLSTV